MRTDAPDFKKKWAIIYSPKPTRKTQQRWAAIRKRLNAVHQPFDFVQSEGEGCVKRLATMFANDGYATIIVVGGDAALGEAADGIMSARISPEERPVLGIIPNGYTNDFANFWKFETDNINDTIRRLQLRQIRKIDVGRIRSNPSTDNATFFLNCINIGVGAAVAHLKQERHRWWVVQLLIDIWAALRIVFSRREFPLSLKFNSESIKHPFTTMCIGSAGGFGQTPSAVPYNGLLDVTAVSQAPFTRTLNGLWLLFTGRFLTYTNANSWRTKRIDIHIPNTTPISLDGRRYVHNSEMLIVDLLPETLNFLV